jgi:hypothetical protein
VTPVPQAPADSDGDGKADSVDACPTERAATANGCPLASVRSVKLSVVKRTHRVKVTVRTDRGATVAIKVERKACTGKGKKQRCKWKAVASDAKVTRGDAAAFTTNRLARGPYRVAVTLSSSAGLAKVVRKAFRV